MDSIFKSLGISEPILKAINEIGYETPTEVQRQAIPHILKGKDMIVISKTGSGKTAVFGIPMLQTINPSEAGPQALIITPTRELAVQVDKDINEMGKYLSHKTTAVYGQHNMSTEIQALKNGVSIVTGTPGRVFDHISKGTLNTKNIQFLVLDEADRMLDMGFIDQVEQIIKRVPKNRITLLFSATLPNEIDKICRKHLKDPEIIAIESETKTVDSIEQKYYRMESNEKRTQLDRVLSIERPEGCIIFCNTKHAVDQVQSFLAKKGYSCHALHGDIAQGRRLSIINQFKEGVFPIMIATDVAARGIHIEGLSMVINYDVPLDKDSYVHRIGRTGRAGQSGQAITFVTGEDIMNLYDIEEHTGAMIIEADLPSDAEYHENKAEARKWIEAKKPLVPTIEKAKIIKPKIIKPLPRIERKTNPQNDIKKEPVKIEKIKQPEIQPQKSLFKKIINKIFNK